MERMKILFSILERGRGKSYLEFLKGKQIHFHFQTVGVGTAPSEMMDIFGLGTNDKDILISLATESTVNGFLQEFGQSFSGVSGYRGLTMVTSLSAINRITAEIVTRMSADTVEKGDTAMTKKESKNQESKYSLLLISVNQGYTDRVMQTARQAGATGGTVIRARLANAELIEPFVDSPMEEEREIITILVSDKICSSIMNQVNAEFGMNTEARGTLCAIPVEKAFKI